jgi:hypothetical protein
MYMYIYMYCTQPTGDGRCTLLAFGSFELAEGDGSTSNV